MAEILRPILPSPQTENANTHPNQTGSVPETVPFPTSEPDTDNGTAKLLWRMADPHNPGRVGPVIKPIWEHGGIAPVEVIAHEAEIPVEDVVGIVSPGITNVLEIKTVGEILNSEQTNPVPVEIKHVVEEQELPNGEVVVYSLPIRQVIQEQLEHLAAD